MAHSLDELHKSIIMTSLNEHTDCLLSAIEKNAKSIQDLGDKLNSVVSVMEEIKETVMAVKHDVTEQATRFKILEEKLSCLSVVPENKEEHLKSAVTDICSIVTPETQVTEDFPEKIKKGTKVCTAREDVKQLEDPPTVMDDKSQYQEREWGMTLKDVDQESTGTNAKDDNIINKRQCRPHPFEQHIAREWYKEGETLIVAESGPFDFIQPCHEFKAFTNATEETKMTQFVLKVITFAAACLNSRTNGTIHFGVADDPHGQILGLPVDSNEKEVYDGKVRWAIEKYFKCHKDTVKKCIKPARFVDVHPSGKYVIEIDIVPHNVICKKKLFLTSLPGKKGEVQFFIREGASSTNLLAVTTSDKRKSRYNNFCAYVDDLDELRKQSEEKSLNMIKSHKQGSRLRHMITWETGSLDRSPSDHYFVVSKFSQPEQSKFMTFLQDLTSANFVFDCKELTLFEENKSNSLELLDWLCSDKIICKNEQQDSAQIAFQLSKDRRHFFHSKKFLAVFLVLGQITDEVVKIVEILLKFNQKLKDKMQILYICANENIFISLKDLINTRCEVNISSRCIYKLSLAEINGTILSLSSKNRRTMRFLAGSGGSSVVLEQEVERQLTTLNILCQNQCEEGNENQVTTEENKGQECWRHFYVSEKASSKVLPERYEFKYAVETITELRSVRKACVRMNIFHGPNSGGTTFTKHILWTLRGQFRCAVLGDNSADPATVAEHVRTLQKYESPEQESVTVLLMIDDFENMEKVFDLQQRLESLWESHDQPRSPHVILLNCMKSENSTGHCDTEENTVNLR